MMDQEPLLPHLADILAHPASEHLILAGGFGLRVKRAHLLELSAAGKVRTLINDLPEARATRDLDFFLKLEAFVGRQGAETVRAMLNDLGFRVKTGREHWQFGRPLGGGAEDIEVLVDILARPPDESEAAQVRADSRRVRARGPHATLHGRVTPEAFAVETMPVQLPIVVERDGAAREHRVQVPHPYAWICMKTMAAHDWLRTKDTPKARPVRAKHPFDVYLLVAMLTESELEQCGELCAQYTSHAELAKIRAAAVELFGSPDAPGFLQVRAQTASAQYAPFLEAYTRVLGL
jgi:hypothetical protein